MVICLERCADLLMAQLMPLPLTVSCFSEIQIGFTFLVPAHLGSPGKRAVKRGVCVCVAGSMKLSCIHPSVLTGCMPLEVCTRTGFQSHPRRFPHPLHPSPPTLVHLVIHPHPSQYQLLSISTHPRRCCVQSLSKIQYVVVELC